MNFDQQGFQLFMLHVGYQLGVSHIDDLLVKLDFRVDIGFVEFAAAEILQLIEALFAICFQVLADGIILRAAPR